MEIREKPFILYDCFTNQQFGGNAGGLVFDAQNIPDRDMLNIANKINAPVTGFVLEQKNENLDVRFFMPKSEIDMCGHVTIGLFTHLHKIDGLGSYKLKTKSGTIPIVITNHNPAKPTVMMQLARPIRLEHKIKMNDLFQTLKLGRTLNFNKIVTGTFAAGLRHAFVFLERLSDLKNISPDFEALGNFCKHSKLDTVSCFSFETDNPNHDIHMRDFCPALGVNETPASGTTNGALAGFLLELGFLSKAKNGFISEQGSEIGRPSFISCEVKIHDGGISELFVGGQAILSSSGIVNLSKESH